MEHEKTGSMTMVQLRYNTDNVHEFTERKQCARSEKKIAIQERMANEFKMVLLKTF